MIAHDEFTNQQLSELRERVEVQVEGKIAGLQTEMRQSFASVNARFESMDARFDQIMLTLTKLTPKPDWET